MLILTVVSTFTTDADISMAADFDFDFHSDRAVELLLAAFERLGMGVAPERLREVLLNEGGLTEESGESGVAPRSQTRKRGVIVRQQTAEKMVKNYCCVGC